MKIQVELNYILQEEPAVFKDITTLSERKVYVWNDKRTELDSDGAITTFQYYSQIQMEPSTNSHMDFLVQIDNETPAQVDDSWFETYKVVKNPTFSLEWLAESKVLRLSWTQLKQSLEEMKLKAKVLSQIQALGLEIPPFAKLQA
jgi:hypothetical protein